MTGLEFTVVIVSGVIIIGAVTEAFGVASDHREARRARQARDAWLRQRIPMNTTDNHPESRLER